MKWIGRLLGSLLAIILTVTAIAWVSNATVWNTAYMQQAVRNQGFYTGVAKALPAVLISPTTTSDQRFVLNQLITPGLVRLHIEGVITQLERYYREGGAIPTLDLSDVKQQFDTLGLTPPPLVAMLTNSPQQLTNPALDPIATNASQQSARLVWAGPIAAAVVAVIIFMLMSRRRWSVLSGAGFSAAIFTSVSAGLVLLLPGIATSNLATSAWGALVEPVRAVATAIAHDQSQQLLWWAVAFALAGVLMGVLGLLMGATAKFRRKPKPVSTPAE